MSEPKCTRSQNCPKHGKFPTKWRLERQQLSFYKPQDDEVVFTRNTWCFGSEFTYKKVVFPNP